MSISQTYGEIKDYEKKQNPEKTLCILMPVRTLTSKEMESLEKYINQQPEWFLLNHPFKVHDCPPKQFS